MHRPVERVNGIDGIEQRIATLRARMAMFQPAVARSASAASSTTLTAPFGATPTSFEDTLSRELAGTAPSTPLRPARKLAPGQYGSLTPPAELARFGNGRIPVGELGSIGHGDHRLYAPAANAFRQLEAAAKADGVTIGINDSYRDFAEQQAMAAKKGLYSQGGLAAAPGTSPHGWGLALDLQLDGKAQAWMRQHAHEYGFVEDVAREPWHWTFRPA